LFSVRNMFAKISQRADLSTVFIPEALAGRRVPTRAQSRRPAGSVREPAPIPLLILPRPRPEVFRSAAPPRNAAADSECVAVRSRAPGQN